MSVLYVCPRSEVSKRHLDHQMRGFLYEAVVEHLQNTLRNLDQVLDSQGGAAAAAEAPPPVCALASFGAPRALRAALV